MKLFVDTSALLALAVPRDRHHREALDFLRSHAHARFVLTELVVSELATRLRALAGARRASAVASSLFESQRYEVIFTDTELLRAGLERMGRLADKELSLTDCVSFELMDRLALPSAFTFDHDFRDCGFGMLP